MIVDSTNAAMDLLGLDPNAMPAVEQFYRALLAPLARLGPAVLLADHPTKDPERRSVPAGSERKVGRADGTVLAITRRVAFRPGATGRASLVAVKDRLGAVRQYQDARGVVAELELASSDGDGRVEASVMAPSTCGGTRASEGDDPEMERRVLDLVEDRPGIVARDLRRAISGGNDRVNTTMRRLVDDGRLRVEAGTRNSQHYFLGDRAPTAPDRAPGAEDERLCDRASAPHPPWGGAEAGTVPPRGQGDDQCPGRRRGDSRADRRTGDDDEDVAREPGVGSALSSSPPAVAGREPTAEELAEARRQFDAAEARFVGGRGTLTLAGIAKAAVILPFSRPLRCWDDELDPECDVADLDADDPRLDQGLSLDGAPLHDDSDVERWAAEPVEEAS